MNRELRRVNEDISLSEWLVSVKLARVMPGGQMVRHLALNQKTVGSTPTRATKEGYLFLKVGLPACRQAGVSS